MASNFKVSVRRKKDNLYLKLAGDFDGSSAYEVLNVLKRSCNGVARVSIDTSGLRQVYSFGQKIFQNNLFVLRGKAFQLEWIGPHSSLIAPVQSG